MKTERPFVRIRLTTDLKAWVEQQAEANHRSMNGEVVHILDEARRSTGLSEQPAASAAR